MAMTDPDPATTAAAEAILSQNLGMNTLTGHEPRWATKIAVVAVAAARPLIEAEARDAERQRIRQLHKCVDRGRVQPCCEGCELECDRCHEWPCPTIRLLDGDDGDTTDR